MTRSCCGTNEPIISYVKCQKKKRDIPLSKCKKCKHFGEVYYGNVVTCMWVGDIDKKKEGS